MKFFEKLKQSFKTFISNSFNERDDYDGDLDDLLNKYEMLNNNEKIKTIIDNFLNSYPVVDIEIFATIPKKMLNFTPKYTPQEIENLGNKIDCIKHTLLVAFNEWNIVYGVKKNEFNAAQCIKYGKEFVVDAYSEMHLSQERGYIRKRYEKVVYLYNSLVEQNLLSRDSNEKTAFYLLLSERNNLKLINLYNSLLNVYDICGCSKRETVIKLLHNDLPLENIKFIMKLRNYVEEHGRCFATSYRKDIDKEVDEFIEQVQEDEKSKSFIATLEKGPSLTKKVSIYDTDVMSGVEFEKLIADMFKEMGYIINLTKASGDQGIDVLAEKGINKIAIQTKCYSGVVGNHAIMEAVAGMKFYNANKCMVVTNSTFTKSARELAQVNGVVLWDRETLKEKLENIGFSNSDYKIEERHNIIESPAKKIEDSEFKDDKVIIGSICKNMSLVNAIFRPYCNFLDNDGYDMFNIAEMIRDAYKDYVSEKLNVINFENYLHKKAESELASHSTIDPMHSIGNDIKNTMVTALNTISYWLLLMGEVPKEFNEVYASFEESARNIHDYFEIDDYFYVIAFRSAFVKYFVYLQEFLAIKNDKNLMNKIMEIGKQDSNAKRLAQNTYQAYLKSRGYSLSKVNLERYEEVMNFFAMSCSPSSLYVLDESDTDTLKKDTKGIVHDLKHKEQYKSFDFYRLLRTFLMEKLSATLILPQFVCEIVGVDVLIDYIKAGGEPV